MNLKNHSQFYMCTLHVIGNVFVDIRYLIQYCAFLSYCIDMNFKNHSQFYMYTLHVIGNVFVDIRYLIVYSYLIV